MKKITLLAALAAAVVPGTAGAATFKGVVVARSHGTVVVSTRAVARTVHAKARVGAVVSVTATQAKDGTFTPSRLRVVGSTRHAWIHGIVVRRIGRFTVLSAGRSLLAVRSGARVLAASDADAQPGTVVDTGVQISNGSLTQTSSQPVGQAGNVAIQATITAVAPGSITVTVAGAPPFTIPLPAGLVLPASVVGQTVQLQLNFAGGNVTANEDDENDDQGDDDQGDDDNGDNGGGGGGDDGD
jgi:hypothetical protein